MTINDKEILNLQGFILSEEAEHPAATGELSSILTEIAFASKIVSREINKAGLVDILGLTGKINAQGEKVQKLDEFANEIFTQILRRGKHVAAVASEEFDDIYDYSKKSEDAKYVVCMDPLDGSSNIDVNVSVGTIFSIYKRISKAGNGSTVLKDFLQKGREQIAAGYVLYGSSTMFVYSTGSGVNGFTLDPSIGEFILSHRNLTIPEKGTFYSVNEGYTEILDPSICEFIEHLKKGAKGYKKPHKARHIGSLVSDFHRNLLKGGIFMYPKNKKSPEGKLRLLFENNPMAFLVEQAGGLSSNGEKSILDIEPTKLHQRTPLFIGSKKDIKLLQNFLKEDK